VDGRHGPTFWTEGADFSAAGLVLPRLGDPWHPLPGEPGSALKNASLACLDELQELARRRARAAACANCTKGGALEVIR